MYGLNTPESRTRDLEEKQYGLAAKARLKELLENGETLSLRTAIDKKARGKYGRILGTIFADIGYSVIDPRISRKSKS